MATLETDENLSGVALATGSSGITGGMATLETDENLSGVALATGSFRITGG